LLGRAEAEVERAGDASADTGDAGEVATDAEIIGTLRRRAADGDVSAARELREWRERESAYSPLVREV
jgi:hypothetical protein